MELRFIFIQSLSPFSFYDQSFLLQEEEKKQTIPAETASGREAGGERTRRTQTEPSQRGARALGNRASGGKAQRVCRQPRSGAGDVKAGLM